MNYSEFINEMREPGGKRLKFPGDKDILSRNERIDRHNEKRRRNDQDRDMKNPEEAKKRRERKVSEKERRMKNRRYRWENSPAGRKLYDNKDLPGNQG